MTSRALTALFVAACCIAADSPRKTDVAYDTPESTIASYWHRMAERRHHAALDCFLGGAPTDANSMLALPDLVELRPRDFRLAWRGRGIVDVEYDIEYRVSLSDPLARFATGDRLRFTGAGWKIERPLLLVENRAQ
jgi:hypothetical protein